MKTKTFRYYVTGHGQFPDDMLRYDQAKVVGAYNVEGRIFHEIIGKVSPTVGRWQSFLWTVVETKQQRERWGLPPIEN